MMWHALLFPPAVSRGDVSLLTSADHEERLRRAPGAGRRRPLLGPGTSQAQARLQPGDLYPPSVGQNIECSGVGEGKPPVPVVTSVGFGAFYPPRWVFLTSSSLRQAAV